MIYFAAVIAWFILGGTVLGIMTALDPHPTTEVGLDIAIVCFWPVVLFGLVAWGGYATGKKVTQLLVRNK